MLLLVKSNIIIYVFPMKFERARTQEQKDIRADQIISAAARLYESVPYERISMSTIARELDFSRGNLYKYFSTKEEIFLKVLERDFKVWTGDVEGAFQETGPIPLEIFAQLWAKVLLRNGRMLERFSLLNYVVHRNVSVDRMVEFLKMLQEEVLILHTVLSRQFPTLSYKNVERFVKMQLMFAIGMHPLAIPATIYEKAIEKARVSYEVPEFMDMFTAFIRYTITGLIGEAD